MRARPIVLILGDSGLRGALIGRLSLQGESLISLPTGPPTPALANIARRRSLLVIDASAIADGVKAQCDSGPWEHILVLGDRPSDCESSPRVQFIGGPYPIAGAITAIEAWRAETTSA